jgi:hypothetical protein
MMKQLFLLTIFVGFLTRINAQFEPVAYDFTGNAMVLQTNPGSEYPYKKLFGLPLLTNIQIFAGSTGFSLNDLFAASGSFEEKYYKTLNQLKDTDFILAHYRQDFFSFGWTDDLERFKYVGLYWDFDHITYIPAQFLKLGTYGNAPYLDQTFDAKFLATKTELVQTIYYGVHKNPNPKLNIGWRFKLYSGLANAQSVHNSGKFYTTEGQNNFYTHHLEDVNLSFQSSGYNENADMNHYLGKLLFSGNYGPGVDFGLSYKLTDKTTITASLLDLGFIYYTTDLNNYNIKGSYEYEGVQLQFPENSYIDYWKDVKDTFKNEIKNTKNKGKYISWRPTTLYTSLKYGLGDHHHQKCENFLHPVTQYTSFIGLTGYAQYRPVKPHLGISGFFEKKWSKHFYTKLNLTADNYSYFAVDGGFVFNIGHLQLSLLVDNLVGLSDLAKSRKQAVHFGLNIMKF